MSFFPILCTTFYNFYESNVSSTFSGSSLYRLPGTIMTLGGTAYHITYEIIIVLYAIAIMLAILALAIAKSQKLGDAKNYLIKVCVVFACICAFSGFLGTINSVASGWF